jgi:integrase/recombinase XerC
MRVLWEGEKRKFFAAFAKLTRHRTRRKAEMLVLYDTGCRVSELAALDLEDYNRDRKSLILINAKDRSHSRREVGLHSDTIRALNAWLRERPGTLEPALFVSQKGQRLSVRQIQDDYTMICKLAGIEPQGVHTLRHSSATNRLDDRTLDIHQVSRRLGHKSIRTTLQFYVHGSVEEEAKAIRKRRL